MIFYVLDTDHLSLYGRNHPLLLERLKVSQSALITTVINVEEQLRGRLAQISEAKDPAKQSLAYQMMVEIMLLTFRVSSLALHRKSPGNFSEFQGSKDSGWHPGFKDRIDSLGK